MKVVDDHYKEVCKEHGVESDLADTNDVMKKLRKKKKPSYQRKRELGNEATKAIYATKNYNTAEYGKLFEIK